MTVIAIAFACTHAHTHTHEERVSFGSFLHHNYERWMKMQWKCLFKCPAWPGLAFSPVPPPSVHCPSAHAPTPRPVLLSAPPHSIKRCPFVQSSFSLSHRQFLAQSATPNCMQRFCYSPQLTLWTVGQACRHTVGQCGRHWTTVSHVSTLWQLLGLSSSSSLCLSLSLSLSVFELIPFVAVHCFYCCLACTLFRCLFPSLLYFFGYLLTPKLSYMLESFSSLPKHKSNLQRQRQVK